MAVYACARWAENAESDLPCQHDHRRAGASVYGNLIDFEMIRDS
jgi:hypothetical protein